MSEPTTRAEAKAVTRDESGEPTAKPAPKVVAATVGAGVGTAASTVLVWIIEASAHIDIPQPVELSVGVLLTAGLAFAAGYVKRPR